MIVVDFRGVKAGRLSAAAGTAKAACAQKSSRAAVPWATGAKCGRAAYGGRARSFETISRFLIERARGMAIATFLASLLFAAPAFAHGDEEHPAEPKAKSVASGAQSVGSIAPSGATGSGRTGETTTETYELVALLNGDDLTLYLDDFATNRPVANARLSLDIAGQQVAAKASAPGVYLAHLAKPPGAAAIDITATIQGGLGDDLALLSIPAVTATPLSGVGLPWLWIGGGFVALLVFAVPILRTRFQRSTAPASAAVLVMLVLLAGARLAPAFAHGDEPHEKTPASGAAAVASASGARAQRLADGSVFAPKPTQHLLGVRTIVAAAGGAARGLELSARITADPAASAEIQSGRGGRLEAMGAFPRVGQRVARGQALAAVAATAPASEAATLNGEVASVERDIAIAEQDIRRLEALDGIVPRVQVETARATLVGLRRQRTALRGGISGRETLRAPLAGVVSAAAGRLGAIVGPGETIFQVVDPRRALVEALTPTVIDLATVRSVEVLLADGRRVPAQPLGRSPLLSAGAQTQSFRVAQAPFDLTLDAPATVFVTVTTQISGIVVPRAALVRQPNGETIVYVKASAMTFAPRAVRSQPLDAANAVVTGGLEPGVRVVSEGAALLAQIR